MYQIEVLFYWWSSGRLFLLSSEWIHGVPLDSLSSCCLAPLCGCITGQVHPAHSRHVSVLRSCIHPYSGGGADGVSEKKSVQRQESQVATSSGLRTSERSFEMEPSSQRDY